MRWLIRLTPIYWLAFILVICRHVWWLHIAPFFVLCAEHKGEIGSFARRFSWTLLAMFVVSGLGYGIMTAIRLTIETNRMEAEREAENGTATVYITWDAIDNAEKYRAYYCDQEIVQKPGYAPYCTGVMNTHDTTLTSILIEIDRDNCDTPTYFGISAIGHDGQESDLTKVEVNCWNTVGHIYIEHGLSEPTPQRDPSLYTVNVIAASAIPDGTYCKHALSSNMVMGVTCEDHDSATVTIALRMPDYWDPETVSIKAMVQSNIPALSGDIEIDWSGACGSSSPAAPPYPPENSEGTMEMNLNSWWHEDYWHSFETAGNVPISGCENSNMLYLRGAIDATDTTSIQMERVEFIRYTITYAEKREEGFMLPSQLAPLLTEPSPITLDRETTCAIATAQGQICYDRDNGAVYMGNGDTAVRMYNDVQGTVLEVK